MARTDDYQEAFRLAALKLSDMDPQRCAENAGIELELGENGRAVFRVGLLGEDYVVEIGDGVEISKCDQEAEVPLPVKVLLSHYLLYASGKLPTGNLITYREIPDGHFYYDAFQRRARDPFLGTFGDRIGLFEKCSEMLGGEPVPCGDVGMAFRVFPRITIRLGVWKGDDEFPPEASILFDENIKDYLPVEDIAVVTGMLVYRLMGIARQQSAER